jgi:YidC/Oxa1 family membrane protein insertase
MAKALLSSSLLPALPGAAGGSRSAARPMLLPPLRLRRGRRGASACEVRAGLHGLDSVGGPHLQAALERAEAALYTLADAAVAAADTAAGAGADAGQAAAVQKNSGWFGFISEALEVVLKVMIATTYQILSRRTECARIMSYGSGTFWRVEGEELRTEGCVHIY